MANLVTTGAMLQCSFGVAPSTLSVLAVPLRASITNMPIANIMDYKPAVNIMPFGMCQSLANPTVAAATAAAFGVLTPMPCIPLTVAPWTPGATKVKVSNMPALLDNCKLICSYGGSISITTAGQTKMVSGK